MDTQTSDELGLHDCRDKSVLSEAASNGAERTLSREAYAMLAQANLLRMRGVWPEAIEKCMAALRLSPDNPSAQSLLGDIYENQGRLDDAIQWYRMALDVQPDSPADRIKLARLLDLKARDLTAPAVSRLAEPAPIIPKAPPPRWFGRWYASPDEMLRRFALVAGALAVLIVLTALLLAHRSLSLGRAPKQVDAPPVVVPSVTASPPAGVSSETVSSVGDPSEVSILNSLRASATRVDQACAVASAQIDPRAGRLTVTVTCTLPAGTTPSRDLVLRDVTSVLQTAAQQTDPQSVTQFTARCLLASPTGGSTPLIFTADAARSAISALNPNLMLLRGDQIASAYANLWWTPFLPQ